MHRLSRQPIFEPGDDLLAIAGVHDHRVGRVAIGDAAVDEHVVENSAVFVADEAVANLIGLQIGDAASDDRVEKLGHIAPSELQPAHVADIEHADGVAGGVVFVGDRRVLDWHAPAGEVDHAAAVCDVPIVERGA